MLDSPKSHLDNIMSQKNWTEHISTAECQALMKRHKDVLQQEVSFLDSQGYVITEKRFPRWCLNKYFLYQELRRHKLVPKCSTAEKALKNQKNKE